MVVAKGWWEGAMGNYCLIGVDLQFGKIKKFWQWMVAMVAQQCEYT